MRGSSTGLQYRRRLSPPTTRTIWNSSGGGSRLSGLAGRCGRGAGDHSRAELDAGDHSRPEPELAAGAGAAAGAGEHSLVRDGAGDHSRCAVGGATDVVAGPRPGEEAER